ncbi:unnamed protein product [Amoebophrya sp. A120]|nr:unnamed protein product [Amoebophrya sp. A120]|eukprot:GSA120T00024737001.1
MPSTGSSDDFVVVLGAQWGDEGKGKLVDILAQKADICCRFNGGANAGHTLVVDGQKFAFHLLPCGMINKSCANLVGNGVVVHIPTMLKELEALRSYDANALSRLYLSSRASLLLDVHQEVDGLLEAEKAKSTGVAIGTTKRGIGPCYSTKILRNGLRIGDLVHFETSFAPKLKELLDFCSAHYGVKADYDAELARYKEYSVLLAPQIVDSVAMMKNHIDEKKFILAEGANAAMLDIDFGTYPYVTSSNTTIGGALTGLGVPPQRIKNTIGVVKAYTTRVGEGPFPTELYDTNGEHLAKVGHEFGTTTGRPRRCGWLDIPLVRYSNCVNGFTSINITKLDVLTGLPELRIGVQYKNKKTSTTMPEGSFPDHLLDLADMEVVYEVMPGWTEDISKTIQQKTARISHYFNAKEILPLPYMYRHAKMRSPMTDFFLHFYLKCARSQSCPKPHRNI